MLVSFKRWVDNNNLALIFITIYFLFSIIKIEHPGVNNDQLMFVNAATLHPDNFFLWKSFHGIPTMVFPYIGALKSYLYMPIFYFSGVNIWSIRLPQIILISLSLFLLYKTLGKTFNKPIAVLSVLFLGLDPSLIAYSRADNGPTVIEFFLKVLTLYLFFLYHKTKKGIIFLSIYFVLALGIFNKINFFWFVNAFLISMIIFYFRNLYKDFKHISKYTILPVIALIIVPYYLLIRLFIKLSRETTLSYKNFGNEVSFLNIFNNFPTFISNLSDIINGNIFFRMIYGYDPINMGGYFALLIFSIILSTFIKPLISKPYFFITAITILISLQILLTKRAVSGWHIFEVYPFLTILLAIGVYKIYNTFKSNRGRLILQGMVLVICTYQLAVNCLYLIKYSSPTKHIGWSSAIYNVIDYAKLTPVKFVCLDVDICNQLLSFNQEKGKYLEPFGYLDPQTYYDSFIKLSSNFNNSNLLYISHGDNTAHFPDLKREFIKYLNENNKKLLKIKEFNDGDNIAFEIYKVSN